MLKPTQLLPLHPRRSFAPRYIKLSRRERDVLTWMAAGKSDWEIGIILEISKKTVNWHVERIKCKFAVPTRIQTVLLAERFGMLKPCPPIRRSLSRPIGDHSSSRARYAHALRPAIAHRLLKIAPPIAVNESSTLRQS